MCLSALQPVAAPTIRSLLQPFPIHAANGTHPRVAGRSTGAYCHADGPESDTLTVGLSALQ